MTDERYYINSTRYSVHQRKTKLKGIVYDVSFRIYSPDTFEETQKHLCGFKTKKEATAAYTSFVTAHCTMLDELTRNGVKRSPRSIRNEMTVADTFPLYMEAMQNQVKESTLYGNRSLFSRFIGPYIGGVKLSKLTRDSLRRWQDTIWSEKDDDGEHFSYAYLSRARGLLSAFLSWCEDTQGIKNEMRDVPKPRRRVPKTEMKFWTEETFAQFLAAVDDPMYRCFFTVLFYTGRRKGEVVALQPGDIRGDKINFSKTLTVKTLDGSPYKLTSTKADKVQLVPICRRVQKALAATPCGSPFVFGGEKPLPFTSVSRKFDEYCAASGVERIRVHDLRHSFVSMLISKGANAMVVADLIGDTVEQVYNTYGHLYAQDRRRIVDLIG